MPYLPLGNYDNVFRETDPRQVTAERTFKRVVYFEGDSVFSSGASSQALARSANFSIANETGWGLDGAGNTWLYGTVILGSSVTLLSDLWSSNWESGGGSLPANLATRDTGATAGYYLDHSAGAAQFVKLYADGGELKTLDITGTLTMKSGSTFKSGSSDDYLQIAADTNEVKWIPGNALEHATAKPLIRTTDFGVNGWTLVVDAGREGTDTTSSQLVLSSKTLGGLTGVGASLNAAFDDLSLSATEAGKDVNITAANDIILTTTDASGDIDLNPNGTITLSPGDHTVIDTGQLKLPGGSSGSPALTYEFDTNLGFFRVGADINGHSGEIRFYQTGDTADYVLIDPGSSGNQLYINDSANPQMQFKNRGIGGAGENYWFHHSGTAFYLLRDSNGDGSWNSPHPWWVSHSSGDFYVGNALRVSYIYNNTSGSAANVFVASTGLLLRATSGRRYKKNIRYDVDWMADIELKPAQFYRTDDKRRMIGFVAEDLIEQSNFLDSWDPETRRMSGDNYDDRALLAVMAAKLNRAESERADLHARLEALELAATQ